MLLDLVITVILTAIVLIMLLLEDMCRLAGAMLNLGYIQLGEPVIAREILPLLVQW